MAVRNFQSRERGEGRLGFLFTILVLAAIIYFVAQSAPLYIHKVQFQDALTEIVRTGALQNLTETEVRTRVSAKAVEFDLPRSATIEVHRKGKQISARVAYIQDITLPFYTWNWSVELQSQESSF